MDNANLYLGDVYRIDSSLEARMVYASELLVKIEDNKFASLVDKSIIKEYLESLKESLLTIKDIYTTGERFNEGDIFVDQQSIMPIDLTSIKTM